MTAKENQKPGGTRTATGPAAITVERLTKAYRRRAVLTGVSFEVRPGEIFGILGRNGAGKTTMVEIVQGLRSGDSGTVRVLGLDPTRERRRLRQLVGSQLQASVLPDRLKVGEALRLFARLADDVVDWRILRDEWNLTDLQRSAFGSLSGGERQRLFVALALVNRPQIVFLDELTQGLDMAARRETWRLIRRVRDQETTVVLVSHYMDEVEQLCDRVAVLDTGRITACGTPAELVAAAKPVVATRFTGAHTAVASVLRQLPGIHDVSQDGTSVEVRGDEGSPVRVAAQLARHGHFPPDFAVVRPSLEDVFLSLTHGADR